VFAFGSLACLALDFWPRSSSSTKSLGRARHLRINLIQHDGW
jgi:hypothetical protein